MAVVIRLNIRGRRHLAFHKVVVADSRAPRDGRHIEILGHYDPLRTPAQIVVDVERARYWMERGAKPSEKVAALFRQAGIEIPARPTPPKKKAEGKARTKPSAGTVAKAKAARARAAAKKAPTQKAAPAKAKKPAAKKAGKEA
ncbi:MAG TPA: 30S ribosomal protein S16 [Candidatus Saccharimonadales bacterium]|nr:30S ribosomal protein S16 [Candidatus Saccharimonadales bacterium]